MMNSLIRKLLPKSIYTFLKEYQLKHRSNEYKKQEFVKQKCGVFEIEIPSKHILNGLPFIQPYRDLAVGIIAKFISKKYTHGNIIDIGANIGDTAAIIATYCTNKIILVEASDYYFEVLSRNILLFPNEIVLIKKLVLDGSKISGYLHHWGGTSALQEDSLVGEQLETVKLSELADQNTCFIKIDTDGYDFRILSSSIEYLSSAKPGIFYENYIRNTEAFESSNELYSQLMQIGYKYFIVWDDGGYHLVSTTSHEILLNINRYLFKIWQSNKNSHKSIYNLDILCLHEKDEDIYLEICEWCNTY
jgi:FkbM family methyltransferase